MSNHQLNQLQAIVAQSNPALIIKPRCQGGLLLEGRFYYDVIFPGASLIVGSRFDCQAVHVAGQLRLAKVNDLQRNSSRQRRIRGIQAIQRILLVPSKAQRASLIVTLLCRRMGLAAAHSLPPEAVAHLVLVDSKQIVAAYRSYENSLTSLANSGRLSDPTRLSWQQQNHRGGLRPDPLSHDFPQPPRSLVSPDAGF